MLKRMMMPFVVHGKETHAMKGRKFRSSKPFPFINNSEKIYDFDNHEYIDTVQPLLPEYEPGFSSEEYGTDEFGEHPELLPLPAVEISPEGPLIPVPEYDNGFPENNSVPDSEKFVPPVNKKEFP